MSITKIEIYNEPPTDVTTYQRRKTVWIATGTFMGKPLSEKGRTETAALKNWKDVAESRYRCS